MKNDAQKRFKPKPAKTRRPRVQKIKNQPPPRDFGGIDHPENQPPYEGVVKGGLVHLQKGATLKDGTRVSVEPHSESTVPKALSFADRYREFIGSIKNMPPDLAENHDHYIHGTPARK